MSQPVIPVIAAVIRRRHRYLICRRPADKRHGGLWEFPGGKLLDGETPFQGVQRELREELALEVTSAGDALLTVRDPGSVFEIQFCTVEADGEPIPLEHSQIEWVRSEDLLEYDLAPSDRRLAEQLAGGG